MAISQASIGNSVTTLYTSTGESATTCIFFCNTHSSSITLSVYIVPSGQTPGAGNIIIDTITIANGDTYMMNVEKVVLDNADTIQAVASTAAVCTSTISYVSI